MTEAPIGAWLNRVHQGDCLDIMGRMPAESVDLVVTSPPYNIGVAYDGYADNRPPAEYIAWQRECLGAMLRLLKPDGAIFYNHQWRVQNGSLQRAADEITTGFTVRQVIIWQRAGGVNHNPGYFLPTFEVIYLIVKDPGRFQMASGRARSWGDCWKIAQEQRNPHPAPFPLALPQRIIAATTAQVVLDPFIGSGTTGAAAAVAGRDYIGCEQSATYCAMARERISAAEITGTGDVPGFSNTDAEPRRQARSLIKEEAIYAYIRERVETFGAPVSIQQEEIAAALGIHQSTVSRTMKHLLAGGRLSVSGNKYSLPEADQKLHTKLHAHGAELHTPPSKPHTATETAAARRPGFVRGIVRSTRLQVWKLLVPPGPGRPGLRVDS